MKRMFCSALLSAATLLAAERSSAHHSFAATYFVDQEITVQGTLTQFLYRNPHSFVKLIAPDASGQMQTWSVEWGGGAQLTQSHVTRFTLKPGDRVVVTGNPGRDPAEHRIRLHKIVRPADGWKWEGVIM
jgi:multidrug efflux pump subunit AcrA (membrane-fusion protein)